MNEDSATIESLLRESGLRVTAPRRAILSLLMEAQAPISHSSMQQKLVDASWDQATTYRTLVKLRETGLAKIVSRADGIDRYVFSSGKDGDHDHAHFECDDCGQVECLPTNLEWKIPTRGRWSQSLQHATIQFRGVCPNCLD